MVGNVGFIFTNGELGDIRDVIEDHRVPAPARVGSIAPIDVMVPPGPTGCDPGQTSFFQVLQVIEVDGVGGCFCFLFLLSLLVRSNVTRSSVTALSCCSPFRAPDAGKSTGASGILLRQSHAPNPEGLVGTHGSFFFLSHLYDAGSVVVLFCTSG